MVVCSANNYPAPKALRVLEFLHAQPGKLRQKFDLLLMRKPKSSHPCVEAEEPAKGIPNPAKQSKAPRGPPRVWPHPKNKPVLTRPFLNLTGRRHVPVFTAGCEVPFLRYKKPQSPFLGRIIRDTIVAREKRTERMHEMNTLIQRGTIEDQWDMLVERLGGPRRLKNEPSWADEAKAAWHNMDSVNKKHRDKALEIAVKLQEVVVKEAALVEEDKKKWRDEKFAKWLERKKQKAAAAVVI